MRRHASRKDKRERMVQAEELNVTPLMNLFVAIVPLLLLSAVFVSITSIDLGTPSEDTAPAVPQDDFVVVVRVSPQHWWVDARGYDSVRLERGDTSGLLDALDTLHGAHPQHRAALLACEEHTPYAEVVRVLDVAAVAGFPDVALVSAADAPGTSAAGGTVGRGAP